jgi:hypothetical protein
MIFYFILLTFFGESLSISCVVADGFGISNVSGCEVCLSAYLDSANLLAAVCLNGTVEQCDAQYGVFDLTRSGFSHIPPPFAGTVATKVICCDTEFCNDPNLLLASIHFSFILFFYFSDSNV